MLNCDCHNKYAPELMYISLKCSIEAAPYTSEDSSGEKAKVVCFVIMNVCQKPKGMAYFFEDLMITKATKSQC